LWKAGIQNPDKSKIHYTQIMFFSENHKFQKQSNPQNYKSQNPQITKMPKH
jgi:hypothetical protein